MIITSQFVNKRPSQGGLETIRNSSAICMTAFRKIGGDIQSHVNHHLVMCKNISSSVNVLTLPDEHFPFSVQI
jgi:hypothetical protein